MLSAFIAYFSILITFVVCSRFWRSSSDKFLGILFGYIIPIIVVAIIFGGRYNTGSDWENYKVYYDEISKYPIKGLSYGTLEPLYVLLNKGVALLGVGSSSFFAIIAVFQFSVVYTLFKEDRALLPFALYFYTITNLSLDMNIVRQTLAMSFVFLASRYIVGKKNKIKCALLIAAAIGFHYSALICIPMLFVDSKLFKLLDKSSLVVIIYILSLLFATIINQYLSGYIQMIEFGDKYSQNASDLDKKMEVSTGYGLIAKHILNLTMVFLWSKTKGFVEKPFYLNAYRLTVLGFILSNVFGISVFLSRMSLYYSQFLFVTWSVISYCAFHNRKVGKYILFVYGAIALYLLMFAVSIYHGYGGISPYTFKWIS